MLRKLTPALVALALLAGLAAAPALAANRDGTTKADHTQLAQVKVPASALAGLANLVMDDWSDGKTRVLSNLNPDDVDGTVDPPASTPEWELKLSGSTCAEIAAGARSVTWFHANYVNDPTYGPRLLSFFETPAGGFVPGIESVTLIHDGPTPTRHAIEAGYSGRHDPVACVDVDPYRTIG